MVRRKETQSRKETSKLPRSKRLNEESQTSLDSIWTEEHDEHDIYSEDDLNKIVEHYEESEFEKLPSLIKSSHQTKIKRTILSLGMVILIKNDQEFLYDSYNMSNKVITGKKQIKKTIDFIRLLTRCLLFQNLSLYQILHEQKS